MSEVNKFIEQFVMKQRGHRKAMTMKEAQTKVSFWIDSLNSDELTDRRKKTIKQNIRRALKKFPRLVQILGQEAA